MSRFSFSVLVLTALAAGCEGDKRMKEPTPHEISIDIHRAPDDFDRLAPDPALQAALDALDQRIAASLGIPPESRAFGLLDLGAQPPLAPPRLAMIRPDALFYGASVPKIAIVWAYLMQARELHPGPLDPAQETELARVIKQSDNALAAKYSQMVGLDVLQRLLESPEYRLYDRSDGRGGLWCGKHYGIDAPRIGDPLADHSHAATVRACLRYYQLMEQDTLGGPQISAHLRQIFATPAIDLHNENFVRGLNGRAVNIIRKSGLWEDWHLDTARVQHGPRTYLLAGMTRHPKGQDYLAQMAAGVDDLLCAPEERPLAFWHELHLFDQPVTLACPIVAPQAASLPAATTTEPGDAAPPGVFTSAPIAASSFFNEAVLSWNVAVPPGGGVCLELRVGRSWDDSWSPWLHVGDWGDVSWSGPRATSFDGGRIDVDYFRSSERYDRAQYRLRAGRADHATAEIRLVRAALCFSDTSGIPLSAPRRPGRVLALDPALAPTNPRAWQRRLPVSFRSQKVESPDLAGRICSPTSLSMVLAYRGVDRPTADVAAACFDPTHNLYGNWPRNVQAAFALGVPGYLTRFSHWPEVERSIAAGQPLIISIRVEHEGDLAGAPYRTTDGHLLVLCGFDAAGNVYVNDPAASTSEAGQATYGRADLEKCWLRGSGGLAYILLPTAPKPG